MIRTQLRISIDLVAGKIAVNVPNAKNPKAETICENKFGLTEPTDEPFFEQYAVDDSPYSQYGTTLALALAIMKAVSDQLLALSDERVEICVVNSTGSLNPAWDIHSHEQINNGNVVVHEPICGYDPYHPFEFPSLTMISTAALIRDVWFIAENRRANVMAAVYQMRNFRKLQKTTNDSTLYKALVCLLGINLVVSTIGQAPRSIRKGKVSYAEFLMWHSVMSTNLHMQRSKRFTSRDLPSHHDSLRVSNPRVAYLHHLFP